MKLPFKITDNFHKHWNTSNKFVISQGGGRSGKTFAIIQILITKAIQERNSLISIVAENVPFLKRGAVRDFKLIMEQITLWDETEWSRGTSQYKFKNGSIVEFFAADNAGKALGSARDYLFINECNNVNYEIAFQLIARTNKRTFLDFNPVSEFWVHNEIMKNEAFQDQWDYVHSTFLDNHLLNDSIKETMLARATKDKNYETVYVKGEVGNLDGLVFTFSQVDEVPDAKLYGLDFGYTQDPTALIGIAIQGDNLYLDEIIYRTGLRNSDISNLMKGIVSNAPIYADSAEPKTIDDLYLFGWNIHPTVKGKDSIKYGIDLIKQYNVLITKRSINLIKEFRNYTWAKDKEGKNLNAPIDAFNHGIDAVRYGVMMYHKNKHEYKQVNEFDNSRRL